MMTDENMSKLEVQAEEIFLKGKSHGKSEKEKPRQTEDRQKGLGSPSFIR